MTDFLIGHRELQKLTCELAETKKITEDYRMQLLAMDAEMTNLKDLANANKEVLKSRTKSMVDTVDTLKERYESLEKRRKNEGEGYQSDIKLLKQKLEHLEQKLILSSVTKTKGKSNLCFVEYYLNLALHYDQNLYFLSKNYESFFHQQHLAFYFINKQATLILF